MYTIQNKDNKQTESLSDYKINPFFAPLFVAVLVITCCTLGYLSAIGLF
jgi:hypothetical protein